MSRNLDTIRANVIRTREKRQLIVEKCLDAPENACENLLETHRELIDVEDELLITTDADRIEQLLITRGKLLGRFGPKLYPLRQTLKPRKDPA